MPEALKIISDITTEPFRTKRVVSLSERVHEAAVRSLRHRMIADFDNTLSDNHDSALSLMLECLVNLTFGTEAGRFALPLPCGAGKTQGVVALARALHGVGVETGNPFCGRSLLIAQTQIESLISLRKDMIAAGVPANAIGLMYSGDEREVPPTTDNDTRPILLVSHARVRGTGAYRKFDAVTRYRGGRRSCLIWDEVLLSTGSYLVTDVDAAAAAASADVYASHEDRPHQRECATYLSQCRALIEAEVARQRAGNTPSKITLPSLQEGVEDHFTTAFRGWAGKHKTALECLVSMHGMDARIASLKDPETAQEIGLIAFSVSVPDAFESIAILDAGHAVNRLVALDKRIKLAPGFDERGVINPYRDGVIKRYGAVTVNFAYGSSGRRQTEKDWDALDDKEAPREVVEVVKRIPANEHVLIWTFKHGGSRRSPDLPKLIRQRLSQAGVDVTAKINGRDRITIETFGRHVGFNNWSHVENVIFAGVLHRDRLDLLASSIAQVRDVMVDPDRLIPLAEVERGEVAGVLYQAISRGRSRFTDDGAAKPMKVWLRHHDRHVRGELNKLLPGVQWAKWYGPEERGGKTEAVAAQIELELSKLAASKVSVKKFKIAAGLASVADQTFKDARELLVQSGRLHAAGWMQDGRSFVPAAQHHGFTVEAA